MKRIVSIIGFVVMMMMGITIGSASAGDMLNGAGASFPYPVYSAWGYDYHKDTGIKVNYQSIGSGGGQRQITNRVVDFGASDAPMNAEKLAKAKLLQFPAVIGGVVTAINLPGVRGTIKLDSESVCRIFLGDIAYWDNSHIKEINGRTKLPHKKITVVHRSDGSGTTAIFTTYLSEACPSWKSTVGAGKAVKWLVGIGGKGNEGVANYIQRVKYSIGYVEFAYAKQNNLKYTLLKNGAGNFVEPSFKSFQDAAASGNFDPDRHFYLWLTNAPGKKAWPIAGATFILLAKEKKDSNKRVVNFYDWAFNNGDNRAKRLIYVPLPDSLKDKIRAYWKKEGLI